MKNGDFSAVTATLPPVPSNGTHPPRAPKRAPKASARSAARKDVPSAPEPIAAEFAQVEPKPTDAPMWLLQPVSWLQAERAPSIPVWTGLAIERHNRIPKPDFLPQDTAPPNRPDALETSREALTPDPHCEIPQSDLAPLGWDPRAVCRKEDNR